MVSIPSFVASLRSSAYGLPNLVRDSEGSCSCPRIVSEPIRPDRFLAPPSPSLRFQESQFPCATNFDMASVPIFWFTQARRKQTIIFVACSPYEWVAIHNSGKHYQTRRRRTIQRGKQHPKKKQRLQHPEGNLAVGLSAVRSWLASSMYVHTCSLPYRRTLCTYSSCSFRFGRYVCNCCITWLLRSSNNQPGLGPGVSSS